MLVSFFSCKKISQHTQSIVQSDYVSFDWFSYTGNDSSFLIPKSENEYFNPILAGFYPDPSICTANGKYYLINSSFSYFPGIPIFESADLVNWKQLGHVITRKEQADFSGLAVSEGLYAPTIRHHNGLFYVICTNIGGKGNFIVTAKNPAGPWSNPILLPEINGIDPDIFFDDNNKVYITHNGVPPQKIALHEGHRAIYMVEYDIKTQKIISDSKLIINGGTDMAIKPVWIEAPHVLKKDGYYYLICAQGGTGYNHSEVVFRSKQIFGPYESYQNNPILTQSHLNPLRENPITSTGHADFITLPNGDWAAVFLGCRPYENDLYNTGRETFLLPLKWENGWPVIVGGKEPLTIKNKKPILTNSKQNTSPMTGNFSTFDDFNEPNLDYKWNFIRTPNEQWYRLKNGQLIIQSRRESIHSKTNYSFIGRRQQHLNFEAATQLNCTLSDTLQTAGIVAFQNENQYLFIGKRLNSNQKIEVFLEKNSTTFNNERPTIIAQKELPKNANTLLLKIVGKGRYYSFYYKTAKKEDWILLEQNVDAALLSTKEAQGFVGTYLAMYTSKNHFSR